MAFSVEQSIFNSKKNYEEDSKSLETDRSIPEEDITKKWNMYDCSRLFRPKQSPFSDISIIPENPNDDSDAAILEDENKD